MLTVPRFAAGELVRPSSTSPPEDAPFYVVLSGRVLLGVPQAEVKSWLDAGRLGHPGGKPAATSLASFTTAELAAIDAEAVTLTTPVACCSGSFFGSIHSVQVRPRPSLAFEESIRCGTCGLPFLPACAPRFLELNIPRISVIFTIFCTS